MHEEPLTIWALYLHTAYTFEKTFNLIMANKSEFMAHETSLCFPADDVNMQCQVQIAALQNCSDHNIIKIAKSCQKCKQFPTVENCICISKQLIEKILKVCIQMLKTLLLPPKADLYLSFGCYVSRVFKDYSSGMKYSIDITWEPMGRHGFRIVWICRQTTFNQTSVGNVDVTWHQFDVFMQELNGFLRTPGQLSTFFPRASKLQRTKF